MRLRQFLLALVVIVLSTEIIGNPLKFPEENNDGRSLAREPTEDNEPRFHHHKKKKKFGCGHKRFKRQTQSEGRFFFPILNYYDTDIIVSNGYGDGGSGCGSGFGGKPPHGGHHGKPPHGGHGGLGGLGSFSSGLGNFGNFGSNLGSLGSGLGSFGSDLTSGFGSLIPSIGNGISPFGIGGGSSQSRPPRPPRPPAPVATRPPVYPVVTRPPVYPAVTRPPLVVSPPQTTTDSGDDGDSEDYDYTDFSTTVRSRPLSGQYFTGHRPMPISNPLVNNVRPVYERPERYFNRYVVRPINRTLQEFYSLF